MSGVLLEMQMPLGQLTLTARPAGVFLLLVCDGVLEKSLLTVNDNRRGGGRTRMPEGPTQ